MSDSEKETFGCGPILAGTLLIHPACFALVFVIGFIFGCPKPDFSATSSPTVYWLEGGASAVMTLLLVYVFTFGIAPLVVSGVGAMIGLGVAAGWRHLG